jgi:DNA-binding NarL/FixJ family response regulator
MRIVVSKAFPAFTIISAGSASECRSLLTPGRLLNPTIRVAFVDLHLPDEDGIDLIRELHYRHAIPAVAVSGQSDNLTITTCIKSGAAGFIEKSSALAVYPAAIRAVLAGGQYFSYPDKFGANARNVDFISTLTVRQRKVLDLVIVGKPNKLIAEQLCLAEGTIRNYVSELLILFEAKSRTELVFAITKIGYKPRISGP